MKNIFKSLQIDGLLSLHGRQRFGNFFMKIFSVSGKIVGLLFGIKNLPAALLALGAVRQGKPDMRTVRTLDLAPLGTKIVRINPESACAVRTGEYHGAGFFLNEHFFVNIVSVLPAGKTEPPEKSTVSLCKIYT